ncbi:DUF4038 domain-containing protein [candidate division KSB1 bacterium]|nr:DUF4038 domain-containing protein [candidate division KSB1 bacterium]
MNNNSNHDDWFLILLCKDGSINGDKQEERMSLGLGRLGGRYLFVMSILLISIQNVHAQESVVLVDDPLTNYSTVGDQRGGTFTSSGWKTTYYLNRIAYQLDHPVAAGKITFDVKGLDPSTTDWDYAQDHIWHTIFGMWDSDWEENGTSSKNNPYLCQLWFARPESSRPMSLHSALRLNVEATVLGTVEDPNAWQVESGEPHQWDPNTTYHNEIIWGNGSMQWFLNGDLIVEIDYSTTGKEYFPQSPVVYLGRASDYYPSFSWFHTPKNITYSNFRLVEYIDNTPPRVISHSPVHNETEVDPVGDIYVEFSEPIDRSTLSAGMTISPHVDGQIAWSGYRLYFYPNAHFETNTTYQVSLSSTIQDYAGNGLDPAVQFSFQTRSELIPAQVAEYDLFEITLVDPSVAGNKYTDVWLRGTFQGPTRTIEIDGFWDGGNRWKVRMAPVEEGNWSYTITSNRAALETSGSFLCTASDHKGFIVQNPDHPYTLMREDGTPWLWKGDTSWRGMLLTIPYETRWKDYIDFRAAHGFNAVQFQVVSYIRGDNFWRNEGGLAFGLTNGSKNYDLLNPYYYQWIDRRIEYALSKGVIPVPFFTWAQEIAKYQPYQFERYLEYLVARYAAYNVIWSLSGEYDEAYQLGLTSSDWISYGQTLKSSDPYDHIVTLHATGQSSSREFGHSNWLDVIMQQIKPAWHNALLGDRVFTKPVVNGEYGYAGKVEDDWVRIGAWDIFTAGGFFTAGFFTTYAPDKGGWDLFGNYQQQLELQILFNFIERTKWWEMSPRDDMVTNGHCFTKLGEEYVIYAQHGGATSINLTDVSGSLPMQWLNPRDGTYSDPVDVEGGSWVNLSPPISGDWVLHIGEGANPDSLPPNSPRNLSMTGNTMTSISMSWEAPLPAEDGDTAASYLLFRDNQLLAEITETQFTDEQLKSDQSYTYTLFAVDDRQNTSIDSAEAVFTTRADTEPPVITQAYMESADRLVLQFNEPLDSLSATNINNYAISPQRDINSISVYNGYSKVILSTALHQTDISYECTVNNVKDQAKNPNTIATNTVVTYQYIHELIISNLSKTSYQLDTLQIGKEYYIDRSYEIISIPRGLEEKPFIRTANADKQSTQNPFLSFDVNKNVWVYVAYDDDNPLPTWLQQGWTDTQTSLVTNDEGKALRLYKKEFPIGTIELGGNQGSSSSSMYIVVIEAIDTTPPARPSGVIIVAS